MPFSEYSNKKIFRSGFFLFSLIFFIWNLFAILIHYIRTYLYEIGSFPYFTPLKKLPEAFLYQTIFYLALCLGYFISKKNDKYLLWSRLNVKRATKISKILLCLLLIDYCILLFQSGITILSGDYYSRFENTSSSILKVYLPLIILSTFFSIVLKYGGVFFFRKHFKILAILVVGLSLLTASRAVAFFFIINLILLYFIHVEISFTVKNLLKFLLAFLIIYLLGQIYNAVRWYSFDLDSEKILISTISDSFNELRSYADALERIETHSYGVFGFLNYLMDYVSRIFPPIIYNVLQLDRDHFWNSSWKFLEPIFWGNKDADFGIRTGLVGEIDLLVNRYFVPIFGFIYGITIKRSNNLFIISFLIFSIPYGLISTSYIFPCLLFSCLVIKICRL